MRANQWVLAVVVLAGCQTYDFERVTPFTVAQTTKTQVFASRRLKPNIMLLVDNSGSMLLPTDKNDARCAPGCGASASTPCAPTCPTRISELKSAMNDFLTTRGAVARLGLTVFPQTTDTDTCRAATNLNAPIPAPTRNDEGTDAALVTNAAAVNQVLQDLRTPSGGTPTASSLDFVGQLGALNDANDGREDIVLLLTDGLPNCSDTNVNNICDCDAAGTCSAMRNAACSCTQASCSGPARCGRGCLDDEGAVASVRALLRKGIRTVVVGFGADVRDGAGPLVLQAMAEAGGFARRCPNGTDAECGGSTCVAATKLCEQGFYSASSGGELGAVLERISAALVVDACDFALDAKPSDPRYLSVLIDGKSTAAGDDTWRYDFAANHVFFQGALCTRLKASTPQEPVNLEFRIVETL